MPIDEYGQPIDDPMMMDPMMMGQPPPPPPMAPESLGGALMGGPSGPVEMMEPLFPTAEEEEADVQIGPVLADWYRKPPRPNKDTITSEAEIEKWAHAGRVSLAMEMVRRLNMEMYGYFEKDKEAIAAGQVEYAFITALRDEHDLACSHIAGMNWAVEAIYRETFDKEEAAAKEDLGAYLFECEQRQHSRSGYANIKWALADTLQKYGMLVGFDAIDPNDAECGLRMRLIDPATVFPIHEGGRGLSAVYRVYNATASSVIGDFYDGDGKVERKVRTIARGDNRRYDPNFMAQVVEYWDRNWVAVCFDDELILLREHGYARCPFTVTYGCFGQQGFTRTSDFYFIDRTTVAMSAAASPRMRSEDLQRTAQPFLYRRVRAHDIEEAVAGLMLTAFRRSINPPVIHKRSLMGIGMGGVVIDRSEGGYTQANENDEFEPFPTVPAPEIMAPLMAYLQQNRITGMPPGVLNGQMPGNQTSGSGMEILASLGHERWAPLVLIIEQFLTERTEWRLELIRDWGEILGEGDDLGTLVVPRRKPNPRTGDASAHTVTPSLLRKTGIRCKVELGKFNPNTLSGIANGLSILYNMGIIDRRRMIKLAGFDPDPDAVLQDIDLDDLAAVPEVKMEKTLRLLKRLSDQAKIRGDWESAIDLEQGLYFIASEMERRMSIGQPSLGPDGQRLNTAKGQGGVPNIQAQGMSMPQFGIDTGTQGGRPQGS